MRRFTTAEASLEAAGAPSDGMAGHRIGVALIEMAQLRKSGTVRDDYTSDEAEQLVLTRAWLGPLEAPIEREFHAALRFVRNKRLTTLTDRESA